MQEAVQQLKAGNTLQAAALFLAHKQRLKSSGITAPDAHTLHTNCSAALLALGLARPALEDALQALRCIERSHPGVICAAVYRKYG